MLPPNATRAQRVIVPAPQRNAGVAAALREAFAPIECLPADLAHCLEKLAKAC